MPDYHIENAKDLPLKSILTDNLEAYRYYILAIGSGSLVRYDNHKKADQLDPSFAVNNYYYARNLHVFQYGRQECIAAIDKAMQHRSKATDLYEMRIRTLYYNIHQQREKAIALREMQAELNPEDIDAYNHLITEYHQNGQFEKAFAACQKLYDLFPDLNYLEKTQAWLLKWMNRPDEALSIMESYVNRFPADHDGFIRLGDIHLALGNLDAAESNFNKVSLMKPEHRGMPLILEHIKYLRELGDNYNPEMLKQFDDEYRFTGREMTSEYNYLDKKITQQAKNQSISQLYPINDSTLISKGNIKKTYVRNKDGKFYKFIHEQGGGKTEAYLLDESIKKAEQLFLAGNDEAALKAFEEAYAQNPGHHFLDYYIRHLKFKRSGKINSFQKSWQKLIGQYDAGSTNMAITKEKDGLYWWDTIDGNKWKLLPYSENEFAILERWDMTMKVNEEEGKVTSVDWKISLGSAVNLPKLD